MYFPILPRSQNEKPVVNLPEQKEDTTMAEPEEMYQCQTVNCGYIYDPDRGDRKGKIPKGTPFEDLPDIWCCPVCGAGKKMFRPLAGPGSVLEEGQ
jgi:rubredoxin